MENQIKIPQFWQSIEKSLSLDVEGISEIKDVLTLLKYTTAESIVKFEKRSEIKAIELEFLHQKSEIIQKYPQLQNFTFASGVYSILGDIASKLKIPAIRIMKMLMSTKLCVKKVNKSLILCQ